MQMQLIRDLRGSWPEWYATLDDGHIVCIYIRHGGCEIGVGVSQAEAHDARQEVKSDSDYAGVTDVVDALNVLKEKGFYYVCPTRRQHEGS